MNRGLAFLALAGLAALPRALCGQNASPSVPEALKESALAVRVFAVVPTAPVAGLQAPDAAAPGAASPGTEGQPPQSASSQSAAPTGAAPGAKDKGAAWQMQAVKYTVPGTPVPFKFVGTNIAVLVQVTPFSRRGASGIVLVTQGQVWVKNKEGGITYRTTSSTLAVDYGEKVFFFPLGLDSSGRAPLRLEIAVLHASDLPEPPADQAQTSGEKGGGPGDKSGPSDKAGK